MKTKTSVFFIVLLFISGVIFFSGKNESKIEKLRKQHSTFLKNHRYNKTLKLSKQERKQLGIPPNKYFEEQFLLEMNPATGRAEVEKKFALQEQLRKKSFQKKIPGSADNAWVERGPNNIPGRTRAMLFDPNDATGRRVFAGGVSGGLWVNEDITNQNSTWTRVGIPENLAVSSITVDENNPNVMYLGTGESYVQGQVNGNGIYKSANGGISWSRVFGGEQGEITFSIDSNITINSPEGIQGMLNSIQAGFGPNITNSISGDLVLVDDGSSAASEGCNSLINGTSLNGNIAIAQRGTCNFTVKVKNAQDQGALAVIIINNVIGNPFVMGGQDAIITIPSVMISKEDGDSILDQLNSETINVTIESVESDLPVGVTLVPGIFHVNDIVTRNNSGTTEIYAAIADAIYQEAPGTLLGNGSEFGLYKSIDGGNTWSRVSLPTTFSGNPYEPNDIEISANNTVWVSTTSSSSFGDGGGTIFSSNDGNSFTIRHVISNGRRTEISVSKIDPDKIYALAEANPIRLVKTLNGFNSTITTSTGLSLPEDADEGIPANDFTRDQAFYNLMLATDPTNDDIVYVGGIDTFRSTDGGSSWVQISKWSNNSGLNSLNVPFVHADIHELIFRPTNNDQAMIATDGGIYYASSLSSSNNSTNGTFSSSGNYNTTQFYWGAIGQNTTVEQFLGGTQDNGSLFENNGSSDVNPFNEISGGDGGYCFIDREGEYLIASLTNNNYTRFSVSNTNSRVKIVEDGDTGSFINPAELDDNLDILYTNGSGDSFQISRFTNLLTSNPVRTNLTNVLLTSTPTAFKVSPYATGSTTLLVGTRGGSLLKVTNANNSPSWSDITGPEFLGSISAIDFGTNENEILVTFHNYGVKSVWFTEDGGTTWQNKEGDFPDIPVKAIMMNPTLNDEVIIGTDLGVWITENFKDVNPNWIQSQNGMQNVKITSFDLRTADNTVLASTYGRGLFTGTFEETLDNNNPNTEDQISIFPNPSGGIINVSSSTDLGPSLVNVYDLNGKQVYSKDKNFMGVTDLDLGSLNSGVYILSIQNDSITHNKKIIIE